MNRPIWRVFTYELRRNVQRKGFLFTTFGLPIIAFVLFFGYRFITDLNSRNGTNQPDNGPNFNGIKHAGYVDFSGLFPDPGDTKAFMTRYDDEAAAASALQVGAIDVYYVIPKDYIETGNVTVVMPHLSLGQVTSTPIRQLILTKLSEGVDQNLFRPCSIPPPSRSSISSVMRREKQPATLTRILR
jgi:ABC-2 type transport system permease protein